MLLVDPRAGSADLIPLLRKIGGVEIIKKRLPSADAAWEFHGIKTGVEVKHLGDVLQCIQNGRFVSQLRLMQETYKRYWLLIVDEFKARNDGELEFKKFFGGKIPAWITPYSGRRNGITYVGLTNWLMTVTHLGGCSIWTVQSNQQAAHWLWAYYLWSKKKKHRSLCTFDHSRPAPRRKGTVRYVGKPNNVMAVLNAMVPKIGWEKSRALSRKFASVEELFVAVLNEPERLKTYGIGEKLAQAIVDQTHKRHKKEEKEKK